jgi:GMP synthase-like glutamine amidotransferase
MMPRVLVFRHVPWEHLGYLADELKTQAVDYAYADLMEDPYRALPVPLEVCAGVISMGGPMSANDRHPGLARELSLLASAVELGKPVLGVCLGAQLLAKAAGAAVYQNPVKEIGWYPIHFRPEAGEDALFAGISSPRTVFHWHGETFDLPAGSVWLASSAACLHQAFRLRERAWGLQFHLETSPEMIAQWLREDAMEGDLREVAEPVDPERHAAAQRDLARTVFGRWARLLSP